MEGIPWRKNSGDAEYQSQDSSMDAPVTIMMRTSLPIEVCSTCPSASRSVVATSDIFHPQGYEDGTDEDEAGQPDVMGNTVIIDIPDRISSVARGHQNHAKRAQVATRNKVREILLIKSPSYTSSTG